MNRLVLLRHAKSSWAVLGQPDHERPLNQRGRLAAKLMGAWLAEQPWRLDAAIISTSARTRQTWERVAQQLSSPPTPIFDPRLYKAEPRTILTVARETQADSQTVLLCGHNPGLELAVAAIAKGESATPANFPTAAIAVFEFNQAWADLSFGKASLIAHEWPKSLV